MPGKSKPTGKPMVVAQWGYHAEPLGSNDIAVLQAYLDQHLGLGEHERFIDPVPCFDDEPHDFLTHLGEAIARNADSVGIIYIAAHGNLKGLKKERADEPIPFSLIGHVIGQNVGGRSGLVIVFGACRVFPLRMRKDAVGRMNCDLLNGLPPSIETVVGYRDESIGQRDAAGALVACVRAATRSQSTFGTPRMLSLYMEEELKKLNLTHKSLLVVERRWQTVVDTRPPA